MHIVANAVATITITIPTTTKTITTNEFSNSNCCTGYIAFFMAHDHALNIAFFRIVVVKSSKISAAQIKLTFQCKTIQFSNFLLN